MKFSSLKIEKWNIALFKDCRNRVAQQWRGSGAQSLIALGKTDFFSQLTNNDKYFHNYIFFKLKHNIWKYDFCFML